MKIVYYEYKENHEVTDFYVNTILRALTKSGYTVKEIQGDSQNLDKTAYILTITELDFLKWYVRGFRLFIHWSQGAGPEESFMKHKSRIRYYALSLLDRFVFSRSKFLLFVSNYQRKYFETKYSINLSGKSYIMPCYNCELSKESFYSPGKYESNTFVYAGNCTTVWQYFDATLSFYKAIEDKYGNRVSLNVYTKDMEYARVKIQEKGIKNYSLDCVPNDELPKRLATSKFGLLLREDTPVNNVATPTKLSTYLSCGLIPIVSNSIKDYESHFNNRDYFVLVENDLNFSCVEKYLNVSICPDEVYQAFKSYWDSFYNTPLHISRISALIDKITQ